MNFSFEMGSCVMAYILSSIKTDTGMHTRTNPQTARQYHKATFISLKKEIVLTSFMKFDFSMIRQGLSTL
jgi:hypothetical protein